MKKIIVSLAVLLTIVSAEAQTRRNSHHVLPDSAGVENRKHHFKTGSYDMAEKLQFTDAQKEQMKVINADLKNKMKELKSSNLSTEQYTAKKMDLLKERKAKMSALLTPEQKEKLKQYKKELPAKRKMDSAKRMEKLKQTLALSDDQVTKLNEQRDAFKSKFEAIKNNQAISADDKKAQMKALKEERRNTFRSILTPDQAKKMQEMKQKRAGKSA